LMFFGGGNGHLTMRLDYLAKVRLVVGKNS
jgi:hypothetical protein